MAEDFSPYMIPNPAGIWDAQHGYPSQSREAFDGKALSFKSATETPSPEMQELLAILTSATDAYLANFTVDSKIPYPMRQAFDREMALFSQGLARQVAEAYQTAIAKGRSAGEALVKARAAIETGMRLLSGKLERYDREFSAWLTLEAFQQQGYTRFLFISEQGATTCQRCLSYHGEIFSLGNVPIPPLHGNCRCELLAMDTRMEAVYRANAPGFLEAFRRAREGAEGGIHLLTHDAFPYNITPDNLIRASSPSGHMIIDRSRPDSWDGGSSFDLSAAVESYFTWLASDARDLVEYLLNAQEERGKKKWNSFGSFMDWLTLGIVSGTWRGFAQRHEEMVVNPSLYNIVNAVTAGALDTFAGAFAPEEPFSLEHWLDIVGAALTVYAAYKTAVSVRDILTGGGDDALRATGTTADDASGIARGAGLTREQIDDIINSSDGHRPNPSTYLSKEYIENHLAMFQGTVVKVQASLRREAVGPPEGTYVMPSSVANELIERANGDVRLLETLLCLEKGDLGDTPVIITISNYTGLRMPNGNEPGANLFWIPGGYTGGKIPEAVIDQVPPGNYTVRPFNRKRRKDMEIFDEKNVRIFLRGTKYYMEIDVGHFNEKYVEIEISKEDAEKVMADVMYSTNVVWDWKNRKRGLI